MRTAALSAKATPAQRAQRLFSSADESRFLAAVSSGNIAKVKQYLQRGYDPSVKASYL